MAGASILSPPEAGEEVVKQPRMGAFPAQRVRKTEIVPRVVMYTVLVR